MILQLAAVVLLWRQSSGHQKQQDLYYRWVGLISLETCVNCTLREKIIFLLWKHNDKKITDSKQIVFQNKIFQCYLNVFFSHLILSISHVIIHHVTIVWRCVPVVGPGRSSSLYMSGHMMDDHVTN